MSPTSTGARAAADRPETTDRGRRGLGGKTILFNCDCHSFQEVALQLMKAVRCDYTRGLALANVVHHTGSATVYSGPRERCEAVAAVLEDIRLRVQVAQ